MVAIINFILFQIGWFACVIGAAAGLPWAGTAVALAVIALNLAMARQPRREFFLVIAAGLTGVVFDTALFQAGLVTFSHGLLVNGLAPMWMVALWMLFATTLNVSLGWLKRNLWLAAVFGAIGGPLAYLAGARLGALVMPNFLPAILWLGAGWAIITPLLLILARRHDGFVHSHDGQVVPEVARG